MSTQCSSCSLVTTIISARSVTMPFSRRVSTLGSDHGSDLGGNRAIRPHRATTAAAATAAGHSAPHRRGLLRVNPLGEVELPQSHQQTRPGGATHRLEGRLGRSGRGAVRLVSGLDGGRDPGRGHGAPLCRSGAPSG